MSDRSAIWYLVGPAAFSMVVAAIIVLALSRSFERAELSEVVVMPEVGVLAERCKMFDGLDVYTEIRREMVGMRTDLAGGLLDRGQEHARRAGTLVEFARLCLGQTVEDLDLAPAHLVEIGLMPHLPVSKGEKP